jgi:tRNA A-37 threonylcarbamoyl transferase component Bud32
MSVDGAPIEPGRVLAGKYRVVRVLGRGGMGLVVEATHVELDERVAVKVLRPELLSRPGAAERVLREARATVKIASEHVVRVFDAGTLEGGVPYIAMEYLEGCDLAQLLCAEGKLPIADACAYVLQACQAVERAHAIGIVHRDLKPANLFLAAKGDALAVKVLDFGISKVLDPASGRVDDGLTSTSALLGSPVYMSPEQLESTRDVDARTDIWSLGIILYELVTGAHPFVAESLPQLCRKITTHEAPRLREARPDAPEELEAIVARCLEKKREDRYPTAAALAEALRPLARSGGSPAGDPINPLARTVRAVGEVRSGERPRASAEAVTPAGTRARPRRRSLAVLAIGALGAAAIGAAAFGGARRATQQPNPESSAAAAPLAAPASILACPPLKASGVEEPSGWLGAAASGVVCLRAQARMGGRTSRTLVPAELLDLPREAVDDFPPRPYDAPGARDRAIDAARAKSAAWVDGEVTKEVRGVGVTLVVRSSTDGHELAHGEGHARALLEAVRAAMEPIERGRAIPSAPDGDPFLLEWYRVRTADAAVAAVDLATSERTEDFPLERLDCGRFLTRTDVLPDLAAATQNLCAGLDDGPRASAEPHVDRSSPGALRMTILANGSPWIRKEGGAAVADLEASIPRIADSEGRSLALAVAALNAETRGDQAHGNDLILRAVHEDPKAVDAVVTPWDLLMFLNDKPGTAAGARAWAPWSTHALCFESMQSDDVERRILDARRVFIVAPSDLWGMTLVEVLVSGGRWEEARTVAAQVQSPGLRTLVEAGEARFAKALSMAREAVPGLPASGTGANRGFYLAMQAAYISLVLGQKPDYLRELVDRYLAPDPILLGRGWVGTYGATIACATAPRDVARKCFARLRVLEPGPIAGTEGLREGAERYAEGDWAGAARAWKPILREKGWQRDGIRDLLADVLDRTGETELADRLDAPIVTTIGKYNGVELAHVRAARRAEKRGDKERARKLAQQVIDAWSVADEVVPAVAEMRKLVARLK